MTSAGIGCGETLQIAFARHAAPLLDSAEAARRNGAFWKKNGVSWKRVLHGRDVMLEGAVDALDLGRMDTLSRTSGNSF
jgi:hypothetical protein